MSSTTQPDVNGKSAFQQLLDALPTCSRDEKRVLLDRVLRDLIGDKPEREYGLYNPDGSSYLYLVPEPIYLKYQDTPEFIAETERRLKNRGRIIPNSEVLARLSALQAAADAGCSEAEIRSLLRGMNPSSTILATLAEMDAAEEAKQASEKGS